MDDRYHEDAWKYYRELIATRTISIADDEDRYSWEECPEYWDKSCDKDDEWECEDKWKCLTSMDEADDDESYRREYSIYERDDRLRLKNKSKSCPHFFRDDGPLDIEKSEIAIFYLSEEFFYPFSIDDKEVGEDQCDEEFREDDTSVRDVGDRFLSYRFEIIWAHHVSDKARESEIEITRLFYREEKVLTLTRDARSIPEKPIYLTTNLRDNIHEYKNHDTDKYDIKYRYHDIRRGILPSDDMHTISLTMESPLVYRMCDIGPELEKYICKEKCHEKEYEKITQTIADKEEEAIGDELFPEYFTEDDGEYGFETVHSTKIRD